MENKELSDKELDTIAAAGVREASVTEIGGMPCNDNVGLEEEAEIMGQRARLL